MQDQQHACNNAKQGEAQDLHLVWQAARSRLPWNKVHARKSGIWAAAWKYGIPRSSLHDHLSGKTKKRYGGPSAVLTEVVEKEIATTYIVLQEFGFPLTKELVVFIIRDLKDKGQQNPFEDGIPRQD